MDNLNLNADISRTFVDAGTIGSLSEVGNSVSGSFRDVGLGLTTGSPCIVKDTGFVGSGTTGGSDDLCGG